MIPFLCLVAGLALGFMAGIAIGGAPIDPEWAKSDLDRFEGGAGPSSPARSSLRAVGDQGPQGPGARPPREPYRPSSALLHRPPSRPGRELPGGSSSP